MKKFIVAMVVVMVVALGGMFIFKDNLTECITNAGVEQAFGTTDTYEIIKEELLKEEGVEDVTYKILPTGAEYVIEHSGNIRIIRFFSNEDLGIVG